MASVRLLNGPCDPRDVEMSVSPDAEQVYIRPMPFPCEDVYAITDTFREGDVLSHATGTYQYTTGTRASLDQYRRALARLGTGRAFAMKRRATRPS